MTMMNLDLTMGKGRGTATTVVFAVAALVASVLVLAVPGSRAAAQVSCAGRPVSVDLAAGDVPTEGADVIAGTDSRDIIFALGGDDVVCASGGNDLVFGGDGDDRIYGGGGADALWGEAGLDRIQGGDGVDVLRGGDGDDVLSGQLGDDRLFGQNGADALGGGEGNDSMYGGSGDDVINGHAADDYLHGGSGMDLLLGADGNDKLDGGLGNDIVRGHAGDDHLLGGRGRDRLLGGDGQDWLVGGNSRDYLHGGSGGDACDGETEVVCDDAVTVAVGNVTRSGSVSTGELILTSATPVAAWSIEVVTGAPGTTFVGCSTDGACKSSRGGVQLAWFDPSAGGGALSTGAVVGTISWTPSREGETPFDLSVVSAADANARPLAVGPTVAGEYPLGDVNCDGAVDAVDALQVARLLSALVEDSGECSAAGGVADVARGDVDDDGVTDIEDALLIADCDGGRRGPSCPSLSMPRIDTIEATASGAIAAFGAIEGATSYEFRWSRADTFVADVESAAPVSEIATAASGEVCARVRSVGPVNSTASIWSEDHCVQVAGPTPAVLGEFSTDGVSIDVPWTASGGFATTSVLIDGKLSPPLTSNSGLTSVSLADGPRSVCVKVTNYDPTTGLSSSPTSECVDVNADGTLTPRVATDYPTIPMEPDGSYPVDSDGRLVYSTDAATIQGEECATPVEPLFEPGDKIIGSHVGDRSLWADDLVGWVWVPDDYRPAGQGVLVRPDDTIGYDLFSLQPFIGINSHSTEGNSFPVEWEPSMLNGDPSPVNIPVAGVGDYWPIVAVVSDIGEVLSFTYDVELDVRVDPRWLGTTVPPFTPAQCVSFSALEDLFDGTRPFDVARDLLEPIIEEKWEALKDHVAECRDDLGDCIEKVAEVLVKFAPFYDCWDAMTNGLNWNNGIACAADGIIPVMKILRTIDRVPFAIRNPDGVIQHVVLEGADMADKYDDLMEVNGLVSEFRTNQELAEADALPICGATCLFPGDADHREIRWADYESRWTAEDDQNGRLTREDWDEKYDANIVDALRASARADVVVTQLGDGLTFERNVAPPENPSRRFTMADSISRVAFEHVANERSYLTNPMLTKLQEDAVLSVSWDITWVFDGEINELLRTTLDAYDIPYVENFASG